MRAFYIFVYSYNMDDLKQEKYDKAYLRMAVEWAKLSHCKKNKSVPS